MPGYPDPSSDFTSMFEPIKEEEQRERHSTNPLVPQPEGKKKNKGPFETTEEIRTHVREELSPMALGVYRKQMLSPDEKIAKAAADTIMKIEGSLSDKGQGTGFGGGFVLNMDGEGLQNLLGGLKGLSERGKLRDVTPKEVEDA